MAGPAPSRPPRSPLPRTSNSQRPEGRWRTSVPARQRRASLNAERSAYLLDQLERERGELSAIEEDVTRRAAERPAQLGLDPSAIARCLFGRRRQPGRLITRPELIDRILAHRRRAKPPPASIRSRSSPTRLTFQLSLEEKERVMTAFARAAEAMGEGAPTDLASVLLFLVQHVLEGRRLDGGETVNGVDAGMAASGSAPRPTPAPPAPGLTVVYHRYGADVATVDTPDGPVQVAPAVVDRIADVAQSVTLEEADVAEGEPLADGALDRPNSSRLANKVRKRDGERCANPGCGSRKGLQAHPSCCGRRCAWAPERGPLVNAVDGPPLWRRRALAVVSPKHGGRGASSRMNRPARPAEAPEPMRITTSSPIRSWRSSTDTSRPDAAPPDR